MPRFRWTDERLDDLAKIVWGNDGRLDVTQAMALHASEELEELIHTLEKAAEKTDRSRFERAAIAAACISPIVTLVLGLAYHAH